MHNQYATKATKIEDLHKINTFLKNEIGVYPTRSDTDICTDLGVSGDDFSELIENYSKEFQVDLSAYIWYFHHEDEPLVNLSIFIFSPPYTRVQRIPVTPKLLTKFAETKKWEIDYPKHSLPKYRYDIILQNILLFLALTILIYLIFFRK